MIKIGKIQNFLKKNIDISVVIISALIAIIATTYFYHINIITSLSDAPIRLDIARRIIDNLTPGFTQIGNVWLPLPQLLMLPFINSDFLWHTGLAGSIMSGASFIFAAFFLYKTLYMLTGKIIPSLIGLLIFITNPNILYMQTAAMSEMLFIMTIAGSIFYFVRWAEKKDDYINLIVAAVFVSASTLTRYEGYLFALCAVVLVALVTYIKTRQLKKIESRSILFATLALTGIFVWLLYEWAIFNDPLYWKNIYSHSTSVISTDLTSKRTTLFTNAVTPDTHNILHSISTYWQSVAHMNGLILTIFASISFIGFIYLFIKKRLYQTKTSLFFIFLPLSIFAFIVISLYSGSIPIDQPTINLQNISTKEAHFIYENNVRYGLSIIIFIVLLLGWVASRSKIIQISIVSLILLQLGISLTTNFFIIYSLPYKYAQIKTVLPVEQDKAVTWFKKKYDGGLILISAFKNDPAIFFMNIDYKNFIHEGTSKYWLDSRMHPEKYATWIFMYKPEADKGIYRGEDSVTKYLYNKKVIKNNYNKVYENEGVVIYKIKTKPEIEIK